jgi:hypothetical protein
MSSWTLPYRSDKRRTSSRFAEISIVENLGDRRTGQSRSDSAMTPIRDQHLHA